MKKLIVFFLALLMIPSMTLAEEVKDGKNECVTQMIYILKLPDVIREGQYSGEVIDGIPHGYGVFTTTNSQGDPWHYIGQWDNGEITGEGGMYWDGGQTEIGTFENGKLMCGTIGSNSATIFWTDRHPDEQGCIRIKLFREDGTMYFDGYFDAETEEAVDATLYNRSGEVFFSGKLGDGFDWDLIYIE